MTKIDPRLAKTTEDGLLWNAFEVRYAFPVIFGDDLFDTGNPTLADRLDTGTERSRMLVFLDGGLDAADAGLRGRITTYAAAHADRIDLVAAPIVVPGGEVAKADPAILTGMQDAIHACGIDRHSYVVAVGGGAVLDAVGLAAATAHRGVRHVRIPTTVLAQNDSGVGVKNAVNFKGIKNYTGTFAPPWAVLNDHRFIEALPERDRIAGIAEAVKVALIRDDAFFDWLEAHADELRRFDGRAERYMIRRCAELHIRQISRGGDPFETGSARPLDYGHWSAHKLESMTDHALRHGEAVAVGIALDARYSVLAGLLPEGAETRVTALLKRLGLPTYHPALDRRAKDGRHEVLRGLADFREHLGGELTITLLSAPGVGVELHEIDMGLMAEAIGWLRDSAS